MKTSRRRGLARTRAWRTALIALALTCTASLASAQVTLFSDGFESGSFAAGGWTTTGDASISTTSASGTYAALLDDSGSFTNVVDASGASDIEVRFAGYTYGYDAGESAFVEWSTNGSSWNVADQFTGGWQLRSVDLPAGADDQSTLFIRFRSNANGYYERLRLDDVAVVANGGAPDPDPDPDPDPGNPFARGPDPTVAALEADLGPFDYDSYRPSSTPGFGSGTIWYPVGTNEGPFAAVAVMPGYLGNESSMNWVGPRLASNGFVVITIQPNSIYEQPSSRADELTAALATIVSQSNGSSPISGLVDGNRTGVMGHSMGGGGALLAARDDGSIDAAIPLAPWNSSTTNFSGVDAATLVVACESDSIAPVNSHALPFYNSLRSDVDKAFMEFNNEDHFCVMNGNSHYDTLGKYIVAWMKAFLDEDTRYDPFLCGPPHQQDLQGSEISDYRDNCPY